MLRQGLVNGSDPFSLVLLETSLRHSNPGEFLDPDKEGLHSRRARGFTGVLRHPDPQPDGVEVVAPCLCDKDEGDARRAVVLELLRPQGTDEVRVGCRDHHGQLPCVGDISGHRAKHDETSRFELA